ncbi:unnamed protein product [Prunus brigantina]
MKKYADKGRRALEFKVGDKVLLKLTPQIWKKINSKVVHRGLIPKYDGPFEVIKCVGNVSYRLKLPDRLKVHPTFHVSFLKPFFEDCEDPLRGQALRAPPVIQKRFDKEVEKNLDHRTQGQSKKSRRTDYLVQWKGGTDEGVVPWPSVAAAVQKVWRRLSKKYARLPWKPRQRMWDKCAAHIGSTRKRTQHSVHRQHASWQRMLRGQLCRRLAGRMCARVAW